MRIYLRVPYHDRREAKANGAHWDPVSKRWYVLSEEAFRRCSRWVLPLTPEEHAYLYDPVRSAQYEKAMQAFKEEHPPMSV